MGCEPFRIKRTQATGVERLAHSVCPVRGPGDSFVLTGWGLWPLIFDLVGFILICHCIATRWPYWIAAGSGPRGVAKKPVCPVGGAG